MPANSNAIALSLRRTFFRLGIAVSFSLFHFHLFSSGKHAPDFLARHDEGPPNVAVLDEPLAVGDVEALRDLEGGDATRIGNGDDYVDLDPCDLEDAASVVGEGVSHRHARPVDRDAVEDRVGSGKVDVLENVGGKCARGNALLDRDAGPGDDDRLA